VNVTCADCGTAAELPDGELLDPRAGYRCVTCTYNAEQAGATRRAKIGLAMIGGGVVMLVICALMWVTKWDIEFHSGPPDDEDASSLFLFIGFGAIALIAIGLSQQRRFRRRLRT
jgi:hypothetical protein